MYKNDIPEHYAVHSNAALNAKVMPDNACGMGESLERLEKECCVLQEQLHLFRDKVSPLLKPFPEPGEVACDEKACKIPIMSTRTSHILAITKRVWDMQNFVDLLARDIDP